MLKVGLVGCGNIASIIANTAPHITIAAVFDTDKPRMMEFASAIGATSCETLAELLTHRCDIIVEAASPAAARGIARDVLGSGANLMVMSVGGLVDPAFRSELCAIAEKNDVKIYVPSGAIGGIDALQAARMGNLSSVQLETRKPPSSLGLSVDAETVVFEGTPEEAIALFPRNINVAMTLALARGDGTVSVRIVADPSVNKNIHTIRVRGDVGILTFTFENEPSANKATSLLAGYSAAALLEKIASPLQI